MTGVFTLQNQMFSVDAMRVVSRHAKDGLGVPIPQEGLAELKASVLDVGFTPPPFFSLRSPKVVGRVQNCVRPQPATPWFGHRSPIW